MIAKQIEIMRQPRIKILSVLETFSLDQLNTIPAGFNNNILWNLGHMIAAQQGVCYKRAGLDTWVADSFFQAYKPGTKPEGYIGQEQLDEIKELLMTSLDQLQADLQAGVFTNYPAWTTRYGAEIRDINDAIAFLPFHEGLHVGYIMGLRKLV